MSIGTVVLLCIGCLLVGTIVGIFIACICAAGGRADEEMYWRELLREKGE